MTPERDRVIDAAIKLTDAVLGITMGESLKHEKHANKLVPLRRLARDLIAEYFTTQRRALLRVIKPNLHAMAALMESEIMTGSTRIIGGRIREAGDDKADKAALDALPDGLLPWVITDALRADYQKILEGTLKAGYQVLAADIAVVGSIKDDAVAAWLRDHSLEKLTGGLDETTLDRLRNALADSYREGADFDGLVETIQSEYADFTDSRAETVAQTELNGAYNAGRKALGLDMGFNEKSWDPDGTACEEVCIPNVLSGWIPMDEDFDSGDDAPPGHPNCDCSLSVRLNNEA